MDSETDRASTRPILLCENEFFTNDLAIGQIMQVLVNGVRVAVYNANGVYYATQDSCPHAGWPLSDGGEFEANHVTCALHGWCFDVTNGCVVRGIKALRLVTYNVNVDGNIGRVVLES